MHFTGDIYFNFDTYDVWRIYNVLLRSSQTGRVAISVEWRPFLADDADDAAANDRLRVLPLAACEVVRHDHPFEYDKYVRALLTMAYQEKDNPGSNKILAVAAHVAGVSAAEVIEVAAERGVDLLRETTEAARALGVTKVPTIVRQGPPVYVKSNAAANYGDAVARLELIDRMINDDGMWELSKP